MMKAGTSLVICTKTLKKTLKSSKGNSGGVDEKKEEILGRSENSLKEKLWMLKRRQRVQQCKIEI